MREKEHMEFYGRLLHPEDNAVLLRPDSQKMDLLRFARFSASNYGKRVTTWRLWASV
jgi:hypothetical protein